jgi:hypothetical protein
MEINGMLMGDIKGMAVLRKYLKPRGFNDPHGSIWKCYYRFSCT